MPVEGVANEDYVLSPATVAVIGREMVAARRTVPIAQARSLRNINLQFRSFKAVDWMYRLVSTAQVQLVGRIPDIRIAGSSQLRTVRAHVVQFTADMSAFDILLNIADPRILSWWTETDLRTDSLHQSDAPLGLTACS